MEKIKRESFIDLTKFVAILLVMISHCNILGEKSNILVNTFYIAIFFFCTGYTFNDKNLEDRRKLFKQIKKIMLYYLMFSGLCLSLFTFYQIAIKNFTLDSFFNNMIGIFYSRYSYTSDAKIILMTIGNSPLWFLTCYILAYSLFYFLKKNLKNIDDKILMTILFLLSYLLSKGIYLLPWSIDIVPFMTSFTFLGNYCKKKQVINKMNLFIIVIMMIVDFTLLNYNTYVNFSLKIFGSSYFLTLIMSILGCLLFTKLMNILCNIKIMEGISELGKYTIYMLGLHLIVYFCIDTIISMLPMSINSITLLWGISLVKITISIIISIYAYVIIEKVLKKWYN